MNHTQWELEDQELDVKIDEIRNSLAYRIGYHIGYSEANRLNQSISGEVNAVIQTIQTKNKRRKKNHGDR